MMSRRMLVLLALVSLAGCAGHPESVTERDTRAACRHQADVAWRLRHRGQIYTDEDPDAPASGATGIALPTQGLSDRFAQETAVSRCIHDTGTGPAPAP